MNMSPTITPTVATDARSNCRMISAVKHQAAPVISQIHHMPAISATMPASGRSLEEMGISDPYADVLMPSLSEWTVAESVGGSGPSGKGAGLLRTRARASRAAAAHPAGDVPARRRFHRVALSIEERTIPRLIKNSQTRTVNAAPIGP